MGVGVGVGVGDGVCVFGRVYYSVGNAWGIGQIFSFLRTTITLGQESQL